VTIEACFDDVANLEMHSTVSRFYLSYFLNCLTDTCTLSNVMVNGWMYVYVRSVWCGDLLLIFSCCGRTYYCMVSTIFLSIHCHVSDRYQNRIEQNWAEQQRTEQNRSEQNRTEHNRTKENSTL